MPIRQLPLKQLTSGFWTSPLLSCLVPLRLPRSNSTGNAEVSRLRLAIVCIKSNIRDQNRGKSDCIAGFRAFARLGESQLTTRTFRFVPATLCLVSLAAFRFVRPLCRLSGIHLSRSTITDFLAAATYLCGFCSAGCALASTRTKPGKSCIIRDGWMEMELVGATPGHRRRSCFPTSLSHRGSGFQ
ncbi:hypothetical protein FN846DRAFT_961529 [Sphaerosporella brunnea]|uniref:Uncharacterized protein n=1 Tax=Sphaerosporella brunnea TaxID=1250544 RepID=A0A5J5EQV6_9PEZI|nr:hypothetical protein FN846DRAFT_961529 [Sphaerosporella brunnea]